ncbi:MAG: NAD(P)/FAD-dependent oxidoreductase [Verrucomicrobiota bacterium]
MNKFDVAIIGGGPAGSAAGSLLARAGKSVVIVEREIFPRFHIGESLIPFGNDVLREMGVWNELENSGFMKKLGAEFTLSNSCGFQRFWFRNNLGPNHARTFQVERAKFDSILLNHALHSGCEIRQPALVESIEWSDHQALVTIRSPEGSEAFAASYVIDASGRDAWIGKKLNLPKSDLGLSKKMAVFAHFENAYRNEGEAEGHITIIRMEEGWFWMIPLDEKKTSVGIVLNQEKLKSCGPDLESRFWNRVNASSEASFRLKNAKLIGDFHAATDYSYRYHQSAGDRWIMAGDAAGFIDPIFSSGVMVALRSGRLAAQTILAQPSHEKLSRKVQARYTAKIHQMTGVFLKMIELFYDNDAFAVFMNPRSLFKLRETINCLVAGQTEMSFGFKCRFQLFQILSWLQRRITIAPRLFFEEPVKSTSSAKP